MSRIDEMRRRMEAAAAAMDFELASRLRDEISLLRGQPPETTDMIDTSELTRQQPGSMGLGSSRARVLPPQGWTKPQKPGPMTLGRNRRKNSP